MGKSVVVGSLLACLVACGGGIDTSGTGEPVPTTPSEQGVYQPPAAGSTPETVADGVGVPSALVTTSDRVLFTTRSTMLQGQRVEAGALFAADQVNGPALLLTIDRQGASYDALATDGLTAFVATSNGRLLAIPAAGGEVTTLATLDGDDTMIAVTTGSDHVYFATKAGVVGRVAKKGGAIETLATLTAPVRGLVADVDALYVAAAKGEETAAGILRVSLDGAVSVVAAGAEPCALVRDGRDLFWTSTGAVATPAGTSTTQSASAVHAEVHRLAIGANVAATTVTSGAFAACALASSGSALYFAGTLPGAATTRAGGDTTSTGFGLLRAPTTGGDPVALPRASRVLQGAGAVALTSGHVYWLTETAVLRLRK